MGGPITKAEQWLAELIDARGEAERMGRPDMARAYTEKIERQRERMALESRDAPTLTVEKFNKAKEMLAREWEPKPLTAVEIAMRVQEQLGRQADIYRQQEQMQRAMNAQMLEMFNYRGLFGGVTAVSGMAATGLRYASSLAVGDYAQALPGGITWVDDAGRYYPPIATTELTPAPPLSRFEGIDLGDPAPAKTEKAPAKPRLLDFD